MAFLLLVGIVTMFVMSGFATLLNTEGEIEAYPDTPEMQDWRRKKLMYQIDNVIGNLNIIDLLFGLIHNATTPKSEDAIGSKWRLAKVVCWRGSKHTALEMIRELKRYGIVIVWHGYSGDYVYFHVRQTQAEYAHYRLAHLHAGGPSWKEQAAHPAPAPGPAGGEPSKIQAKPKRKPVSAASPPPKRSLLTRLKNG